MAIRWGVIGTGQHPDLKVVPAMMSAADTDVVAAYSRDIGRARAFCIKHGIQRPYDSVEGLLADPDIDAVFISSPNFLHGKHTVAAAAAGKHVLVEKPMATSIQEANGMVRACKENGVMLGVGFQLRHHPGHIKARELIRDGALGHVSLAQAQWCTGIRGELSPARRTGLREWWEAPEMIGGASMLMRTGVHILDLLQFLLDQPIVEVAAITDGRSAEQSLENRGVVSLRFKNGAVGTVTYGRLIPDTKNDATVYGTDGRISLSDTILERMGGEIQVVSDTVELNESYQESLVALYRLQVEAEMQRLQEDAERLARGEPARVVEERRAAA